MMSSPRFTITVQTYNRREMLRSALESLAWQTFRDFEVAVVDNGTQPSTADIVDEFRSRMPDGEIRLIRNEANVHSCDAAEQGLAGMRGDYYLLLADDDILVPHALERVRDALEIYPNVEFFASGFAWYSFPERRVLVRADSRPEDWTGEVTLHSGKELAISRLSELGYGPARNYPAAPAFRFSTCFIRADLIRRIRADQGQFYLRPHGESMVVATAYRAGTFAYIASPLGVIGEHEGQDVYRVKSTRRERLVKEKHPFQYSKLKGLTWSNIYYDHYLTIHERNGMAADYPIAPRPILYLRQINEVLKIRPATWHTLVDSLEALPFLAGSFLRHWSWSGIARLVSRKAGRLFNRRPPAVDEPGAAHASILEAGLSLDRQAAMPLKKVS